MHSPGPSASDIQSHLYTSLLQASTYDVALRVSGTWDAIYKLHRVILIQSGFFRSLFTGGFSESAAKLINLRNGTDEINLIFDDLNITRPAFEVCISRLYGGGPALHVHPNLIPTNNYPLTPPFAGVSLPDNLPLGSHPASPRFLLSLLATAIYLSIPAVASQALSLILKTIGPTTVIQYLDFARGKPISSDPKVAMQEPQAAVGLEEVAVLIDDGGVSFSDARTGHSRKLTESLRANLLSEGKVAEDIPSVGSSGEGIDYNHVEPASEDRELMHHYGAISDKIGEACTCWLTRWANDMLHLEAYRSFASPVFPVDSRTRSKSLSEISGAASSQMLTKTVDPPVIWRRRGLTSDWAAAIISADNLFVRSERERYDFARAVVELRRQEGVIDDEEIVWQDLFEHGIYYVNMSFDDLLSISQDISPTTKNPYVSLTTLHASHWAQSTLRHTITQHPHIGGSLLSLPTLSPSPPLRDKEAGFTITTVEILTRMGSEEQNSGPGLPSTLFYPVYLDSSARFGDSGTILHTAHTQTSLSMEELFNLSHVSGHAVNIPSVSLDHSGSPGHEGSFFGLKTASFFARDCVKFDPAGTGRWSPYPPYRFSVEFWDVDLLREKSRLHSQTVWHAGSLFNVYVQIVRKKEQAQLGIYLHRQSHVDPIPASSAPYPIRAQVIKDGSTTGFSGEHPLHLRQPSLPSVMPLNGQTNVPPSPHSGHHSPSIHPPSRSSTPSTSQYGGSPTSSPSSPPPSASHPGSPTIPATKLSPAPQQPYRDPRPSISAYFAITCASATGTSQTRFSSSPDVFSVSQSWGWKSSTLRTEDFVEVGSLAVPNDSYRNEKVSLRATVLLGLV